MGFIVVSFAQLEQKAMLTLSKGITIYKTLIVVLDFLITITFTIKILKIANVFVLLTRSVIMTQKK